MRVSEVRKSFRGLSEEIWAAVANVLTALAVAAAVGMGTQAGCAAGAALTKKTEGGGCGGGDGAAGE